MESVATPAESPAVKRSFGASHRDFWRLTRKSPLVFMIFPTLIFIPLDLVSEVVTANQGLMETLRTTQRINQIGSALLGTYLAAIVFSTLKAMTEGRIPTFGESLKEGGKRWGDVCVTSIQAGWRLVLGYIFFIIPGVILSVRYTFSLPVTVFEGVKGKEALKRSSEDVKGNGFYIFKVFTYPFLIYVPIIFSAVILLDHVFGLIKVPYLSGVISTMPINWALACMTFGFGFAYLDVKHHDLLQKALNATVEGPQGSMPAGLTANESAPLPWAWIMTLVSWGALAAVLFLLVGFSTFPLMVGNYYISSGDNVNAVHYYEIASKLGPDDFDTHFSIGSQLLNSPEDRALALKELQRAVEIKPESGEAHLYLAILYSLESDSENAQRELGLAEEYHVESGDLLKTIKESIEGSNNPIEMDDGSFEGDIGNDDMVPEEPVEEDAPDQD